MTSALTRFMVRRSNYPAGQRERKGNESDDERDRRNGDETSDGHRLSIILHLQSKKVSSEWLNVLYED